MAGEGKTRTKRRQLLGELDALVSFNFLNMRRLVEEHYEAGGLGLGAERTRGGKSRRLSQRETRGGG